MTYDYEKSIKNSNKGHVDVKVLDGKDFFRLEVRMLYI